MTKEEAREFGLNLLRGIMERNESYPVYADNVKQAIEALSAGSSEIPNNHLEQPVCDGLEEEIERYLHSLGVGYGGWVDGMEDDDLRGIARHFAQWQKQHDAELIEIAYNDGITIGMTKQKEQMMKEAVDAEVWRGLRVLDYKKFSSILSSVLTGEKVKLLIIKED